MHRRLGVIVGAADFRAITLFGLQLHGRLKTIDVEAQCPVELGRLTVGQFPDEAVVADHLPDDVAVLLFDVALIIALLGAPAADQ